jgi:hypothetical protein
LRYSPGDRPAPRPSGGRLRFSARPLTQIVSPEARGEILKSANWLKGFSSEASQKFATVLDQQLRKLCKDNAVSPATQIHEGASIYYARPVFCHLFRTSKTVVKRSASGVWYIFYELTDTTGDGRPDVLGVVTILHGAAQAPWEAGSDNDSENDDLDNSPQETG